MSLNLVVAWESRRQASFAENKGIRGRIDTPNISQGASGHVWSHLYM